ncbi:MAG: hypothetical protein IJ043_01655 [Clostridia bacterium]|nr:hypothetical protein [Clostridia bacterium]
MLPVPIDPHSAGMAVQSAGSQTCDKAWDAQSQQHEGFAVAGHRPFPPLRP